MNKNEIEALYAVEEAARALIEGTHEISEYAELDLEDALKILDKTRAELRLCALRES